MFSCHVCVVESVGIVVMIQVDCVLHRELNLVCPIAKTLVTHADVAVGQQLLELEGFGGIYKLHVGDIIQWAGSTA